MKCQSGISISKGDMHTARGERFKIDIPYTTYESHKRRKKRYIFL